jgi:hypothetical protein
MKAYAVNLFAAALLAATPALAIDTGPANGSKISTARMSKATITDFSAARRKHSSSTTTSQPATPVWTGADPTKGPGIERMRAEQRAGRCVMDEGYGRFTYCDAW